MRKRFTEQQIIGILHELDAGATAKELGRRHGVHPNTIATSASRPPLVLGRRRRYPKCETTSGSETTHAN